MGEKYNMEQFDAFADKLKEKALSVFEKNGGTERINQKLDSISLKKATFVFRMLWRSGESISLNYYTLVYDKEAMTITIPFYFKKNRNWRRYSTIISLK